MGKPLRVLMVEDSPDDVLLVVRELRRGGYEPTYERVETEEDLRLALEGGSWDLVISDYTMPRFQATEALELVKERELDAPFVVVSGSVGEEIAVETMRAGANDYVMKDKLTRLSSAVTRELREAAARRLYRETTRRLEETETRYRSLVEQMPAVTYVQEPIESDNPKAVTYMSPQYETMFGYPPEKEILDEEHWLRTLHPDDRDRVLSEEERTDATGEPFEVEYRVFAGDGSVVWVRDQAVLVRDEEGKPLYWQGVQFDITDQKRIEEALRESEERFRATFEQAAVGMAHVDLDGRWLHVNERLLEIVGYDREELLGLTFQDITHPDDLDADLDHLRRLLAGAMETYSMEKRYLRKDGSAVWTELTVSLVRKPSGDPEYFIVVVEDITRRRLTEQRVREAREAERSRIAQDMHDDALQSLVYALQEVQLLQIYGVEGREDALEDVADALRRSVEGLRSAIFELRLERTLGRSFATSLRELVGLTRRMSRKRFAVNLEVEEGFPKELSRRAGGGLIRILQEAMNNARRHSSPDHISVRLWREGDVMLVEVADDGRGFDAGSPDGGVGLSAMRQRASSLGGGLTIESKPDSGTRVRFEVPLDALMDQ